MFRRSAGELRERSEGMAMKLDGVKVLDLSRVLAGPYCTMILADLGADVIKVEPPEGDETRTWPPFYENGESGYYMTLNRNKRGIAVNLKNPRGKEILLELARHADIVIENFTPGVVGRLGVDYEAMKHVNPRLVYCSVSGFGQTGPYRTKRAYDPVIQALGGVMSVTGVKNGEPVKIGIPVGDLGGAMMAVTAILAALYSREKTGKGDYIDISMLDGQIVFLSIMAAEYFANGTVPERLGREHPWRVPSKTFETKKGYITTSATSGALYARFMNALGLDQLIDDPRFRTNAERVIHRDELYPIIEKAMMEKTAEEWAVIFDEAGLPNGVMNDVSQVFNDPQVLERKMLEYVDHPTLGKIRMIGNPFKYAGSEPRSMTAPPMLGEHTDLVMAELLGLDDDEIASLKRSG
ncbi:MAG: CoA transferase, partial [Deltaproteobacteria bacterium]|nr:CoA transferase [Deltaproteobacteria bacterium]